MPGNFAELGVQTDAEKGFLLKNSRDKLVAVHGAKVRQGAISKRAMGKKAKGNRVNKQKKESTR